MSPYIDIHAHHEALDNEKVVQQSVDSIGIHPWDVKRENAEKLILEWEDKLSERLFITAIGECGLDKVCDAPLDIQEYVFRHQIAKSESLGVPLILHCVKAQEEILRIRKDISPLQPWIFHGFRGKPQQLEQLIRAGMYVSFGVKYNADSLLSCPLDRLFLETDEVYQPIKTLYSEVASLRNITVEELQNTIEINFLTSFYTQS